MIKLPKIFLSRVVEFFYSMVKDLYQKTWANSIFVRKKEAVFIILFYSCKFLL